MLRTIPRTSQASPRRVPSLVGPQNLPGTFPPSEGVIPPRVLAAQALLECADGEIRNHEDAIPPRAAPFQRQSTPQPASHEGASIVVTTAEGGDDSSPPDAGRASNAQCAQAIAVSSHLSDVPCSHLI